jgi:hypothetical protein
MLPGSRSADMHQTLSIPQHARNPHSTQHTLSKLYMNISIHHAAFPCAFDVIAQGGDPRGMANEPSMRARTAWSVLVPWRRAVPVASGRMDRRACQPSDRSAARPGRRTAQACCLFSCRAALRSEPHFEEVAAAHRHGEPAVRRDLGQDCRRRGKNTLPGSDAAHARGGLAGSDAAVRNWHAMAAFKPGSATSYLAPLAIR